jgi:hypothetical protein
MFKTHQCLFNTYIKDKESQKAICKRIAKSKPSFARSLAGAFQKGIKEDSKDLYGAWSPWAMPTILIFGGLGLGGLLTKQSSTAAIVIVWILLSLAIIFLFVQGLIVRNNLVSTNFNRKLISILK